MSGYVCADKTRSYSRPGPCVMRGALRAYLRAGPSTPARPSTPTTCASVAPPRRPSPSPCRASLSAEGEGRECRSPAGAARRGDAETGKTGGVPPRLRLRQATRGLSRLTRSSRRRRDRSRQPSPEAHGSPAALPSARHASLRRVATPCRYAASLRRVATRPRVWAAGATLPCRRDAPARQAPGVGERGCRAAQTLLGCAESRGLGPVCCETSGCAGHGLARTDTD